MARPRLDFLGRLRSVLGPDAAGARQGLVSLAVNSSTSLVAGAFLGAIVGTLESFPGLLVLVPAAIGMRGNIFGAFGNRVSTSIHAGTFNLSARRDTVLGQNVLAAAVLTLGVSLLGAVAAKTIAVGLGVPDTIGLLDLALVSLLGGVLASLVVLGATVSLTAGAVRYGWDLDNVCAPVVSTLGDVLTLPALFLATFALGIAVVTTGLAVVLVAGAVAATVWGLRTHLAELRRIVRESLPVLVAAASLSALAGVTLERSFDDLAAYPALFVLQPAFVSSAGALGGILSARLSSKLLLGLIEPTTMPGREARADVGFVAVLAVPVCMFNGVGAHVVGLALDQRSPGLLSMVGASLLAGMLAMVFVAAVSYYGTVAAFRTGLDPDTYGIPVVSSSVDFTGALTLIVVITSLGII